MLRCLNFGRLIYRCDNLDKHINSFVKAIRPNLNDVKASLLKKGLFILFNDIDENGKICQTVCEIKNAAIDVQIFIYALELVKSIYDSSFDSYKWLNNAKVYESQANSFNVIIELFSLFHNLIINNRDELKISNLNNIIAQLSNINYLSRSLDPKCDNNTVYHFRRLEKEYFNPDFVSSLSFSQEGEDLVLKRIFLDQDEGFFVDVGAHHPTRFSNTYLLYCKGWRGINIEPFPGSMDLFNSMRPRDINIEAAVGSPKANDCQINYVILEETAYNYVINGNIEQHENYGKSKIVDTVKVPLRTLDDILEENARSFEKINLLNIDIEGEELEVFKGFSLKKYLPDIIIVEIKGFSFDSKQNYPVYLYLSDRGYKVRSIFFNSIIFERTTK
jgi:FkbM family methyltransferase